VKRNTAVSDVCKGRVEKLLPGGDALVRSDDGVILVANGIPEDEVMLQLQPMRRGVRRGKIIDILNPSPLRVEPSCPVADRCGGCAFQFLESKHQAELKSAWVRDAFRPLINRQTEWMPVASPDMYRRRRVRWQPSHDDQGLFLGFYASASHQAVRHDRCMMLTPELQQLHALLQQKDLKGVDQVQAVQLSDGIHIVFEMNDEPDIVMPDSQTGLALQSWWRRDGISRPLSRPVKRLHDVLPAGCEHTVALEIGPDAFVQGQFEGNQTLIRQIQAWAGQPRRIADLFCGAGNLSLPLAVASGASVFGAELSEASVRAASGNAQQLGVHGHFVSANLFEDFDIEPYIGADVLILDAPRRGAKRICNRIQHLLPEKIIMVSCDIAAGGRDGGLLAKHGYQLKALRALDMFACAGHVEAISLWEPE